MVCMAMNLPKVPSSRLGARTTSFASIQILTHLRFASNARAFFREQKSNRLLRVTHRSLQVCTGAPSELWKMPCRLVLVWNHKDSSMRRSSSGMISKLELENYTAESHKPVNSIYWLLLVNLGLFVADHMLQLTHLKALYLYHVRPQWYQFFTATLCHFNWKHLSSNLFFLYIFGKLVEEEEGGLALWISYLVTGAGANLVSWLILPRTVVSVGASGAVFGLFAISVLVKISWNWRKILEVFILGQFVLEKVMEAAQASAQMAGQRYGNFENVNHIAHLFGAVVGAALIWLISRIPSQEHSSEQAEQRKPHLSR